MERDQQGYSTTNGLFAIINALRALPGRKSMVFFSEGLVHSAGGAAAVPRRHRRREPRQREHLHDGRRRPARRERAGEDSRPGERHGRRRHRHPGRSSGNGNAPLSKPLEKNEDVLRQDPHNGLGTLAQDTGGLLFDNTNNLRQGFDRVESDLRNYYLRRLHADQRDLRRPLPRRSR